MTDLVTQLELIKNELRNSMNRLRKNGELLAQAEHDYQVIKAQTVMIMKDAGCTITEINMSIKGQPQVAEALLERDKAKVMYEANQEHINVVKLEMRVLENQIAREWHNVQIN